jgi:hypothetical protein
MHEHLLKERFDTNSAVSAETGTGLLELDSGRGILENGRGVRKRSVASIGDLSMYSYSSHIGFSYQLG